MDIKHVFFDLDHTLWDFERNSKLTFQEIFKEHEISIAIEDFLEVYVPINLKYWRLYREGEINKEVLRYNRLSEVFETLNYPVSDTMINTISENYITYMPKYSYLFDGTIDVLNYLKDKYELHIITNGFEELQKLKMETSGIKQYFNCIITSESVGIKKPNPEIFEHAISLANAKVEHSIMIGDSYEADIMGALNMGMLAIHCNYDSKETANGVLSIKSITELKKYL